MNTYTRKRKVNLVSQHNINWLRQCPEGKPVWGSFEFVFNDKSKDYDWLVVFDDANEKILVKDNFFKTIHIATEPPTVHRYDKNYLNQFSYIVSIQNDVKHNCVINSPLGLNWHIGLSKENELNFDDIDKLFDFPKKN